MNRQTRNLYFGVGCGAAAGSLLRHLVGLAFAAGDALPVQAATAAVNIAGSFVIVLFAVATGPDGRLLVGPAWRQAIMSGLCGGLTTFSSMSLDTLLLAFDARPILAGAYLAASIALSLAAAWAGHAVATRYNRGLRA